MLKWKRSCDSTKERCSEISYPSRRRAKRSKTDNKGCPRAVQQNEDTGVRRRRRSGEKNFLTVLCRLPLRLPSITNQFVICLPTVCRWRKQQRSSSSISIDPPRVTSCACSLKLNTSFIQHYKAFRRSCVAESAGELISSMQPAHQRPNAGA